MKIYTRTGDDGGTALFGGGRVPKSDIRVCAYGEVDELNSVLGWAITQVEDASVTQRLSGLQHDLFSLGSDLATPPARESRNRPSTPDLPLHRIDEMEAWIDASDAETGALREFILPGGVPGAAALRAVSRIGMFALIPLGIGLAVLVDRLAGGRRRLAIVLVVTAVFVEQGASQPHYDKLDHRRQVARLTARVPANSDAFLYVAGYGDAFWQGQVKAMWAGTRAGKPTVYGYSGKSNQNKGHLVCIKLADGAEQWRTREVGHGAMVQVDGHLMCLGGKGDLFLIKPDPSGFKKVTEFPNALPNVGNHAWTRPVIANGKLYLRYRQALICYDLVNE